MNLSARVCGPKCSICCALLSVWGIVMLGIMGILFYVGSPILAEDVTANWDDDEQVVQAYKTVGVNCWIAAAIYIGILGISLQQFWMSKKRAAYQTA